MQSTMMHAPLSLRVHRRRAARVDRQVPEGEAARAVCALTGQGKTQQPNAEAAEKSQRTQKIPNSDWIFFLRLLRIFAACVRLLGSGLASPR